MRQKIGSRKAVQGPEQPIALSCPLITMDLAATKRADGEGWFELRDGKPYLSWYGEAEARLGRQVHDVLVIFEETPTGRIMKVGLYARTADKFEQEGGIPLPSPDERYIIGGLNLDTGGYVDDICVRPGKVELKHKMGERDREAFRKIAAALLASVDDKSGCLPRIDYLGKIPLATYVEKTYREFLIKAREVFSRDEQAVDVRGTPVTPPQLPPPKTIV